MHPLPGEIVDVELALVGGARGDELLAVDTYTPCPPCSDGGKWRRGAFAPAIAQRVDTVLGMLASTGSAAHESRILDSFCSLVLGAIRELPEQKSEYKSQGDIESAVG